MVLEHIGRPDQPRVGCWRIRSRFCRLRSPCSASCPLPRDSATHRTVVRYEVGVSTHCYFFDGKSDTKWCLDPAWWVSVAVGLIGTQPLAEFWNGQVWRQIAVPGVRGSLASLRGVAAVSKKDVWAIGDSIHHDKSTALIEHWNGQSWHVFPMSKADEGVPLWAISAAGAKDIWTLGHTNHGSVLEHWNGASWHVFKSAISGSRAKSVVLNGIHASRHGGLWVTGSWQPRGSTQQPQPLVAHWNGTRWTRVPILMQRQGS